MKMCPQSYFRQCRYFRGLWVSFSPQMSSQRRAQKLLQVNSVNSLTHLMFISHCVFWLALSGVHSILIQLTIATLSKYLPDKCKCNIGPLPCGRVLWIQVHSPIRLCVHQFIWPSIRSEDKNIVFQKKSFRRNVSAMQTDIYNRNHKPSLGLLHNQNPLSQSNCRISLKTISN